MIHELKIWPQYYCRVADGTKTFEVRNNDRGFQPGDKVILREWDPAVVESLPFGPMGDTVVEHGRYTRNYLEFLVGYVFPIDAKHVVFSLLPPPPGADSGDEG